MTADNSKRMTRKQEYDQYAKAENQAPQGPARRRKQIPTELVQMGFEAGVLDEVVRHGDAADHSVSAGSVAQSSEPCAETAPAGDPGGQSPR